MRKLYVLACIAMLSMGFSRAQTLIFSEDFHNGINPAWGNSGTSNGSTNPYVKWRYTHNGSHGAYAVPTDFINSPSKANGFIIFDSDSLDNGGLAGAFGLGPAPAPQVVQLTTTAINVAAYPYCKLEFYQYFRNFQSTCVVGISTDSLTWVLDTVNAAFNVNGVTPSNSKVSLDLTQAIHGQPKVYIRFYMLADYYFWMIDDISIISLPNNDLSITNTQGSKGSSGLDLFYSSIPSSQCTAADSFSVTSQYGNIGRVAQRNCTATFALSQNGTQIAQNTGAPLVSTLAYRQDTSAHTTFGTNGTGNYTVAVQLASDSIDYNPADNVDTLKFAVSDSTFSINSSLASSGDSYFLLRNNSGVSFRYGTVFEVTEADTVTSITTALMGGPLGTHAGAVIQAQIYPVTVGTFGLNYNTPQIQSHQRVLAASDITTTTAANLTPVTMLIDYSSGNPVLQPGLYWVAIQAISTPDSNIVIASTAYQKGGFPVAEEQNGTLLYFSATDAVYCNLNFGHYSCPVATVSTTPVSCDSTANGTATVALSQSSSGFTYTWSAGGSRTATAAHLPGGQYTVTVSNGYCRSVVSGTVHVDSSLHAVTTVTPASCRVANGSISVAVTGGDSIYAYLWSTIPLQTGPTALGLSPGPYTVTVTSQSCFTIVTASVTNPGAPAASISSVNPLCADLFGSATVTTSVPGVTYSWSTTPIQNTATAANLHGGVYSVTVDSSGCLTILHDTIVVPAVLRLRDSVSNVSCFGNSDGCITLTASGGVQPYSFLWTGGLTTAQICGLQIGNYSCIVTDSNNCRVDTNILVVQPAVVSAFIIRNQSALVGLASGGTPPYHYQWNTGPVADTLYSLAAGVHTITVTDRNGCSAMATFTILSIESIPGIEDFNISPNPTTGAFVIKAQMVIASDVEISVSDIMGRKIYESSEKNAKDLSVSIDIAGLARGTYIVSLRSPSGILNQKIVLE